MTLHGKQQLVKGGVLFALADTLAAHSIGGFKVGVGFSLCKCRMCLATSEQISKKVHNVITLLLYNPGQSPSVVVLKKASVTRKCDRHSLLRF